MDSFATFLFLGLIGLGLTVWLLIRNRYETNGRVFFWITALMLLGGVVNLVDSGNWDGFFRSLAATGIIVSFFYSLWLGLAYVYGRLRPAR